MNTLFEIVAPTTGEALRIELSPTGKMYLSVANDAQRTAIAVDIEDLGLLSDWIREELFGEDGVSPYLLTGDELDRAEAAAKEGRP